MINMICKKCGDSFEQKHHLQRYCSKCRDKKEGRTVEPKNGYDTIEKQIYRFHVWEKIRQICDADGNKIDKSKSKVLFMPGKHGKEIDMILESGFIEENIYACDRSAAVLATAKWRSKYKGITAMAGEISDVFARLSKANIRIQVANIDLCNNISKDLFVTIDSVMDHFIGRGFGHHWGRFVFAVTVLKGREESILVQAANAFGIEREGKFDRMKLIETYIKNRHVYSVYNTRVNDYKSGNIKMEYGVFFGDYDPRFGFPLGRMREALSKKDLDSFQRKNFESVLRTDKETTEILNIYRTECAKSEWAEIKNIVEYCDPEYGKGLPITDIYTPLPRGER